MKYNNNSTKLYDKKAKETTNVKQQQKTQLYTETPKNKINKIS